jgi:hypothetical protein
MPFILESRRRKPKTLNSRYPSATFIDLTSKASRPWVKFSPFFPHGGIPVPVAPTTRAHSVEGIWQGLKVFKTEDVNLARFEVTTMRGLKRAAKKFDRVIGHRNGLKGDDLLDYVTARKKIYLPAYKWVLENKLQEELEELREMGANGDVVLLDYETNADVENTHNPLSHASLVIAFLEDRWPA